MNYLRTKLKYGLTSSDAGSWGEDPSGEADFLVLRSTEIGLDGEIRMGATASRHLTASEHRRTKLLDGDLLVVRSSGSDAHLGKVGYVDHNSEGCSFSNFIQRLRVADHLSSRFAWYFLNSFDAKQQIRILSSTTTGLQNLSASTIGELQIPIPGLAEQRRIVDFLDAETARMDRAGEAMRRQIDVLAERRLQALDTVWPADPDAPMKRLGYGTRLVTSGSRGWADFVGDSGSIFFRSANLRRDSLSPNLTSLAYVRLPPSVTVEASRSRIRGGDVLVGITGANTGWVALADDSLKGGNVSQHVCLVRPARGEIHGRWLAYLISSPTIQTGLMGSQYGGTKTQLSLPDIRDLRVPVLPIASQKDVAAEMDGTLEILDRQRELRNQQLRVLAERRQALITAAVTGQIDVSTASGRGIED
ncbi:restriction endonuclease subunit S [Micromonospora taraxaci]|uniref:restriction endonuclease subunit S n=1 Tax=Micromonospora taraxaci TaxID=1316803 RepID=UPI0033F9BC62